MPPITQPQTIKKLIADLRVRKQLDEEVIRHCRKELLWHALFQLCILSYLVYEALTETNENKILIHWQLPGIMLLFVLLGLYLHSSLHKMRLKHVNFWRVTSGTICKIEKKITKIRVKYFYEVNGKKYEAEQEIVSKADKCFRSHPPCEVGGEISVLYRPDKPEIRRLFTSELQKYNLNKNKHLIENG